MASNSAAVGKRNFQLRARGFFTWATCAEEGVATLVAEDCDVGGEGAELVCATAEAESGWGAACCAPTKETADTAPVRPESVSRLSRGKSARRPAACWKRRLQPFSSALLRTPSTP